MKSPKRLFVIILLVFFGQMLVSCGKSNVRVIKLASALSPSHPVTKAMKYMAKQLKKKSNGKLQIKVYPSGQLGDEREALELLQIGSIGMTKVSAAAVESFNPNFKAVDMPYIFKNDKQRFRVLQSKIGKSLLLGSQKYWMRGLCYYDAGSRSFYSTNKPIRKPSDLKGMKIRVQNSDIAVQMVQQLGGSATPVPFGELYSALQQGVVDGAENNPPSLYFSRQYEVSKYYSLDKHTSIPDVLFISTILWNQLNSQQQKWIQEAADESAKYERKLWAQLTKKSLKEIKESGVKIIHPDKSLFAKKVQPMYERYKTEHPDLYKKIQAIIQMQNDSLSAKNDSL